MYGALLYYHCRITATFCSSTISGFVASWFCTLSSACTSILTPQGHVNVVDGMEKDKLSHVSVSTQCFYWFRCYRNLCMFCLRAQRRDQPCLDPSCRVIVNLLMTYSGTDWAEICWDRFYCAMPFIKPKYNSDVATRRASVLTESTIQVLFSNVWDLGVICANVRLILAAHYRTARIISCCFRVFCCFFQNNSFDHASRWFDLSLHFVGNASGSSEDIAGVDRKICVWRAKALCFLKSVSFITSL